MWNLFGAICHLIQRPTGSPSQAVLLCSMPSVSGRCDLHPLNTVWERCRFRLVEVVTLAASRFDVAFVV